MSTTPCKPSMDARLVNPLVMATTEILQTMAQTPAKLKEIQPSSDYIPQGDLSAIIGVMGHDGEGMVSISFKISLANTIVSRLLGVSINEITSEDRCDGIGELVNMISGNAKTALSEHADTPYRLSLPTIVLGAKHEIARRPLSPFLVLHFEAEGETFCLQISFKTYNANEQ
jgi:chemotaxis protein CheX